MVLRIVCKLFISCANMFSKNNLCANVSGNITLQSSQMKKKEIGKTNSCNYHIFPLCYHSTEQHEVFLGSVTFVRGMIFCVCARIRAA